jgi:hypothetical protein
MTTPGRGRNLWTKLPITLRAISAGFLISAAATNVWLLLLLSLGVQLAAIVEAIFLALFLGWARGGGPQSLGFAGNGSHRIWCRRIAGPSRMVCGIAHSGDHRSFCDGRRAVRLLVDRYRWRIHCASNHRNRCGSAFPHRLLCVCDLACYRAARDLEAP